MANQRDSSIDWVVAVSWDHYESFCYCRAMEFGPIGAPVADLPTTEIPGEVRTAVGFRSGRFPLYIICVGTLKRSSNAPELLGITIYKYKLDIGVVGGGVSGSIASNSIDSILEQTLNRHHTRESCIVGVKR